MRMRLVHGFTQTARTWGRVEARLPGDWDVQALEVPDGLEFVATADALGRRGGEGTWVGYSMGARLCLRLALDHPGNVHRLALMSGSPGIDAAAERKTRRAADDRLASDAERDGVAAFLERWLDQRMFETLPREAAMIEDRRLGNTVGRVAHQLRALGPGTQEPLWNRLPSLEMPVLLVTGAYDRKYQEIAQRMTKLIGDNARHEVVPRAGHSVHLERPEEVAQLLADW